MPYRVLDSKYTFGVAPDSGNMIIHGDNLEALKALLPQYEGKVKCIYIDPPTTQATRTGCTTTMSKGIHGLLADEQPARHPDGRHRHRTLS